MPGCLNSFQRAMLHWNDLHPYNAMLVFRLPMALERERLAWVINGTLEGHGLTGLTLNRTRGTFHYAGGRVTCEINPLAAGADPQATLVAEIDRQLNTPFAISGQFNPFRFFTMPQADGFSLGVVFIHVVADGEAIMLLMREIIETYLNPAVPRSFEPLELYPQCKDGLLSHPKLLLKKLASLPAQIRDTRQSNRRACANPEDGTNRFMGFVVSASDLETLVKTAKKWNTPLNDLVMALMLMCFARLKSDRQNHPRRRKISFGCIVNIRKGLELRGRRAFGPFLGSFVVSHELPAGIGLMELAKDIKRQSMAIKKSRLYMASGLELAFGRFMASWQSPARKKTMYAKNFPLWGGVTNINFNAAWPQASGAQSVDCFGAVSTGPTVPLVFAFMMVRDVVNLTITYRPAFYTEAEIGQIKTTFLELVAQLKP